MKTLDKKSSLLGGQEKKQNFIIDHDSVNTIDAKHKSIEQPVKRLMEKLSLGIKS